MEAPPVILIRKTAYEKAYRREFKISIQDFKAAYATGAPQVVFTRGSESISINMTSQRYELFNRELDCISCTLSSSYLWIESNGPRGQRPHLNLYAITNEGKEMMMTKDHIIPKSKGGANRAENYQLMCERCNCKKSNNENFVFLKDRV